MPEPSDEEQGKVGITPPPPPPQAVTPSKGDEKVKESTPPPPKPDLKESLPQAQEEIVNHIKHEAQKISGEAINRTSTIAKAAKAVPILGQNTRENFTSMVANLASQTQKKREESPVQPSTVSTWALLSYANSKECWLMFLGLIMAAISGSAMPAWLVLLAKTLDKFSSLAALIGILGGSGLEDVLRKELNNLALGFALVGVVSLISGTLYVSIWTYTGQQQSIRIKQKCIDCAFHQDATWFDSNNRNEIPTNVANSMAYIEDAISKQMIDAFSNIWSSFGCLGVALYLNYKLALFMLCIIPVIALIVGIISIFIRKRASKSNALFAEAGALASETITGIKTISSLNAERKLLNEYKNLITLAQKESVKSGALASVANGIAGFLFYAIYTFAFSIGTIQVEESQTLKCLIQGCAVSGASVMTCIYGVILSATFYSLANPGFNAISLGRQAAATVFAIINHNPDINTRSEYQKDAMILRECVLKGSINFKNVFFAYPTAPKSFIFQNFNLDIEAGESVAFVGPSGSGKSTISRLLLRMYDPVYGEVLIDNEPLQLLNIKWWRNQIGYVCQEPALFPGTIRDNILVGKPDATEDDIINAAKDASAHEFIMSFPNGYDTFYSGASIQLSGGQMQRICIARAIIRRPTILLLDEATSALDSQSEKMVQEALENIRKIKKITTISVAHRLSTIMNCDKIAVISDGNVAELGTHYELLSDEGGIYSNLCASQGITIETSNKMAEKQEKPVVKNSTRISVLAKSRAKSLKVVLNGGDVHFEEEKLIDEDAEVKEEGEVEEEKDDKEAEAVSMARLWEYNRSEFPYLILGLFGAVALGVLPPCEGIITAEMVNNFYTAGEGQLRPTNFRLASYFLILAVISLFGNIAMGIGFSVCGSRLTRKMRVLSFEAIVRRTISWFDYPEHSTGELTSRLETDAEAVSKVTGWALGYRIRVFASLTSGVIISLVYNWVIGIVAILCVPLIMLPAIIQSRCDSKSDKENTEDDHKFILSPATVLEQGLRNIASVQAYNLEEKFSKDYKSSLGAITTTNLKAGAVAGLVFGFSQFAIFISFSIMFLVGSYLLIEYHISFVSFFTSLLAVMFGALGVAQINADFNARADGLLAAGRLFAIIDEPLDDTDPFDTNGIKPDSIDGEINFEAINFYYPTRPEHPVYFPNKTHDGLNLNIKPHESVAFVGKSGCGKSTALQIFLRFYSPSAGMVTLDGKNISELNLAWLRENVGYVGQMPVLFSGSVRSNITLGKPNATEEEIVNAAKAANAHDFIVKLTNGYDTDIGVGGGLLSGGQRQRVSIARAIIKDPKILVLDEATAALDNESERIVQEALDDLQRAQPRTTLVVAHRLITVKNCTKIAVLDGGGVKELGSHDELLQNKDGLYYALWQKQGAADE